MVTTKGTAMQWAMHSTDKLTADLSIVAMMFTVTPVQPRDSLCNNILSPIGCWPDEIQHPR